MYVREKTSSSQLGDFGIIVQGIVAAAQAATLGAATAIQYSSTKKYLKTEKHTILRAGTAALALKKKELASRERLLRTRSQTELLSDVNIKKLVIIGSITVSALAVLGIVIYYMLTTGGEDE